MMPLAQTIADLEVGALAAIVAVYSARHRAFYEPHESIELTPLSALRVTQRTGNVPILAHPFEGMDVTCGCVVGLDPWEFQSSPILLRGWTAARLAGPG